MKLAALPLPACVSEVNRAGTIAVHGDVQQFSTSLPVRIFQRSRRALDFRTLTVTDGR